MMGSVKFVCEYGASLCTEECGIRHNPYTFRQYCCRGCVMKNVCSLPSGPSSCSGITLESAWEVRADMSYDIVRQAPGPRRGLSLVRTWGGEGSVQLQSHDIFDLVPSSLLVVEDPQIRRWRCCREPWCFWWFGFTVNGPPILPLHHVMNVPAHDDEHRDLKTIFDSLRRVASAQRCFASAAFGMLMSKWRVHWEGVQHIGRHEQKVQHIIEQMRDRLDRKWPVGEMAGKAGMSERLFRDVFERVTGQSPKRFHTNLRLATAAELLGLGIYNVSEIAERLGYSSPYHFSKAFRRRFGTPPSRV